MALRSIVRFPDPRLRQATHEVTAFDASLHALVSDMIETMYACEGAGLAAIQIGALERVFVVEPIAAGKTKHDEPVVFVNPVLEWLSPQTENKDEGCLSFPSVFVPIRRALQARVRAQDLRGQEFVAEGVGLYARAMQHEMDHLNNKLLIDYAGPLKKRSIQRLMEHMTDAEAEALLMEHGE